MSQKFLTPIDLNRNELQNAVIQQLAASPSTLVEGLLWARSDTHHVYAYLDSAEVRLDNPTAAELLTSILTVDGASSGLDADKLDGQEGTYYLSRTNHTGTQTASTISDFDTQVRTSRLDQMAAPTASVSMNSQKITNLATPTSGTDAATKSYVDSAVNGFDWKASVRAASTANVTIASGLESGDTLDGVTLATGDRVLLKDQSTASQNGIYVVAASGAASRASDADASSEVTPGLAVFVEEGTANGNTAWLLTTDGPITLDTTSLTFTQFGAGTSYTAGTGIDITGNQISISTSYVGQVSINTLGTISTGVWNASTIAVNYGGTGATTASGARTNLGLGTIATQASSSVTITGGSITGITDLAVADGGTGASTASGARTNLGATGKYSATIGDGSSTSISIAQATHGLATNGQMVAQVFDATSGAMVLCDVTINNSTGAVTFAFSTAPTSNQYRVVIVG